MRVAIDGFWLIGGPPSGKNVLQSIVLEWASAFPDDDITVVVPNLPDTESSKLYSNYANMSFKVIRPLIRNHGFWVMFQMGMQAPPADLVFTQNFSPILSRNRNSHKTVFLHDLIFKERPEWFTLLERVYLNFALVSLQFCQDIVTSSASERYRIIRFLGKTRIKEVSHSHLGVPWSIRFASRKSPNFVATPENFILVVGRLNARKNINSVIAAFAMSEEVLPESCQLVVVGTANGKNTELPADLTLERVIFAGGVSDGELAWLYSHCLAFVFPSLDEGFGIPLLEAQYFGARILSSDIPVFRELGVSHRFFDPNSLASIASTFEGLQSLKQNIPERGKNADWLELVTHIRKTAKRGPYA